MADIHPPMLTDIVTNPLMHSMQPFWDKWSITHADLNNILNTWLVMIILIVASLLVKKRLEMIPKGAQNFWEVIVSTLEDIVVQTMGEHGRPYFPLIASLALFILACNLIGILPWLQSATNNLNTTLALALVSFVTTHYVGIKMHGARYVKHFMGPVPWLVPLMLPIELIGHFSRIISLSFRLFGNIMGEDLAIVILTLLLPYLVPLPMMVLQVFTSFIQTLVFIMLTMMYISGSLEEAH
jgi:F-type H+-transporting ATPase subunit a|uniref:ATP synthase subunit a n=1 Tax=Desulfomonile tiedjei TaxID=2358 RepID=A0A7C4EUW6_9BACT